MLRSFLSLLLSPALLAAQGLLLALAVVWFGGAVLFEYKILVGLTNPSMRMWICIGLVVAAVLFVLLRRLMTQRKSKEIADQLSAQAAGQLQSARPDHKADLTALDNQFKDALAWLQNSRLGSGALYALPWYVIIGPPGCGKTTMLVESTLNFHEGASGASVRGIGGTRNCDWFFADQGILLDTAGRYATEADDQDEWLSFLDMLKKARRRKPINGAIVCMSISDLMMLNEDQIASHAAKIRARVDELTQRLELLFPAYLVFTKCDLIGGFTEIFGTMSREERGQVWGWTLAPDALKEVEAHEVFEQEFDRLYERLGTRRLNELAADRQSRVEDIYTFPIQFALAKERISDFVRQLTRSQPYQEASQFRGFYFTSGTQEGQPMHDVLDAMGSAFGVHDSPSVRAPEDTVKKSYFIDNLFTKVIFADHGLARSSAKAEKRRVWLRRGVMGGSVAAALFLCLQLVLSFMGTRSEISHVHDLVADVRTVEWTGEKPSPDETLKLERLRVTFEELNEPRFLDNLVLGRGVELEAHAREAYVDAIKRCFILPGQEYLRKELIARADAASKDVAQHVEYKDLLRAYLALSNRLPTSIDAAELEDLLEKHNVWAWSDRGAARATSLEAVASDRKHLHTLTDLVIARSSSTNWCVSADEAVIDRASRVQTPVTSAALGIVKSTDERVPDVVEENRPDGWLAPRTIPDSALKSRAEREREIEEQSRKLTIDGADADKTKEVLTKEVLDQLRETWRAYLLGHGDVKYNSLTAVATELDKAIGVQSGDGPLHRALRTVRTRVKDDLGDPVEDEARLIAVLDESLGYVRTLREGIRDFIGPKKELKTVDIASISADAARIDGLNAAFRNANNSIQNAFRKAALGTIGNWLRDALTKHLLVSMEQPLIIDIRFEAGTHWEAEVGADLDKLKSRYPFNPDGKPVDMAEFTSMFRIGGRFDAALAPLTILESKVSGLSRQQLLAVPPQLDADRQRVKAIQTAMFEAGANAAKIEFHLLMEKSGKTTGVRFTYADNKPPRTDEFTEAFESQVHAWDQGDVGGNVELQTESSRKANLWLAIPGLADRARGPWGFFELIRAGQPVSVDKTKIGRNVGSGPKLQCTYSCEYKEAGTTSVEKGVARIWLTTVAKESPFVDGFFDVNFDVNPFRKTE